PAGPTITTPARSARRTAPATRAISASRPTRGQAPGTGAVFQASRGDHLVGGPEVPEHGDELAVGPERARLDGADGQAEAGGGLLDGVALEVQQPDDLAGVGRQLLDGPADLPHDPAALQRRAGDGQRRVALVVVEALGGRLLAAVAVDAHAP